MNILEGLVICKEHRCPYITIGENMACAFEYLDDMIGNSEITSIETVETEDLSHSSMIFEGKYRLPIICPCCGNDACVADEEKAPDIIGLYLVGMSFFKTEEDKWALSMVFSEDPEGEPKEAEISTSIESISRLVEI